MHFPGAGVGGHCLPKDTWLLMHGYTKYATIKPDYPSSVLIDARHLNDWMPIHMVDLLEAALTECDKKINTSSVAVLGYAFLENSDDARNSPTISLIKELEKRGVAYKIHDPYVKTNEENYPIEADLNSVLQGSDALVLMTKHDAYKAITPESLKNLMRTKIIIDGRNLFDPVLFNVYGFTIKGVGKGIRK
jgi:UDP-N-acetyl-D-mannosaminuronic acid dehydrogenase